MRTSKQELAKMLAPLTVLPGGDRLNKAALEGYYAVFRDYYPHELRDVIRACFVSCEFFPTPKQIMERLTNNRRVLGSDALEKLQQRHEQLQLEAGVVQGARQALAPAEGQVHQRGAVRPGLHPGQGDWAEPEGLQGGGQAGRD